MIHAIIRAICLPFKKICDDLRKKRNQRLMMSYVLNLKPVLNKEVNHGFCKI